MTSKLTDAEVCMAAARLIRRWGWVQRKYRDLRNRYCIFAALMDSDADSGFYDRVFGERGRARLIGFNDRMGTTQDEVIALLQSGAYSLGGRG